MLCLSEGILVPLSVVLMITATSLGPVSLVATLTGTRPFFVLLYSSLLSVSGLRVLEESLSPRAIAGKLVSVTMIVSGIVLLSLLAEGVLDGATPVK